MIDLDTAARLLLERFGGSVDAPYVPGKTLFRDALCDRAKVSQAEAEEVCDSLERGGAIRFANSAVSGDVWAIDPSALSRSEK